MTFVVFGAAFMKPLIERATWRVALYALLSLTGMLQVAIAMLGTRASAATTAYLGWFGPRGLASIVFAVLVVEANIPRSTTIVEATALTVTAGLHGLDRRSADRALYALAAATAARRHRGRRDPGAGPRRRRPLPRTPQR